MLLARRGLTDHSLVKFVHWKDNNYNNLLEKVQIPLSNLEFPQYNAAAKELEKGCEIEE